MYAYEGLGCIYWHMVAKLLLAVQEVALRAEREGQPGPVREALARAYYRIRAGLGFEKTAAEYGAFPMDPYSHTPPGGGAQQPGMTGQVKEEILTRFGELGVTVRDGLVGFRPRLLRRAEFLREPGHLPRPRPRRRRPRARGPGGRAGLQLLPGARRVRAVRGRGAGCASPAATGRAPRGPASGSMPSRAARCWRGTARSRASRSAYPGAPSWPLDETPRRNSFVPQRIAPRQPTAVQPCSPVTICRERRKKALFFRRT